MVEDEFLKFLNKNISMLDRHKEDKDVNNDNVRGQLIFAKKCLETYKDLKEPFIDAVKREESFKNKSMLRESLNRKLLEIIEEFR